jgi:hypothetical protein
MKRWFPSAWFLLAGATAFSQMDFDQLLLVKRHTYGSNHYYTEFINSPWMPGGNLCVLHLKTGAVREIVPQLKGGVFERFDLSFDAKRVVFAWKASAQAGYRIYEVRVDGTGLRQLTFPPPEEEELVKNYCAGPHYHHGTDDMQPCYLPDGGIAFISTRCQFGILCDGADDFSTTVLYRMDGNGRNHRKLTNSSVSEASPVMMPDGRILYTRWEYVDKGVVLGENHPKTGNVDYLPARSLGSHASVLVAMLAPNAVRLADAAQAGRARKLAAVHRDVKLRPEELLRITNWVDTNAQFYGTYWGRKHLAHKAHPDFRPRPAFEMATGLTPPFADR